MSTLYADLALAQRFEAVEAHGNRVCVEAAGRANPSLGCATLQVGGGWAMFHTKDSPLTQAFGVGMQGPVTAEEMDRLEEFFRSRGAAPQIETCPLAHDSLRQHLNERGYRVLEWSNVLTRRLPLEGAAAMPNGVQAREARQEEISTSSRVAAEGFFGGNPALEMVEMFNTFHAAGARVFLAWVDETPAGTGGMAIVDGVVNCFGDATLMEFRGRGLQSALIQTRLATAARDGATLAMVTTMPGTISQRNYERAGYRVAYTRCKFILS